jgi:hypothetical protein
MESDAGNHFHAGGFLGAAHAPLRVGKGLAYSTGKAAFDG